MAPIMNCYKPKSNNTIKNVIIKDEKRWLSDLSAKKKKAELKIRAPKREEWWLIAEQRR